MYVCLCSHDRESLQDYLQVWMAIKQERLFILWREVAENIHMYEVTFSLRAYFRPGHTTVYPHACISSQEAGNILLAFWPRITQALM